MSECLRQIQVDNLDFWNMFWISRRQRVKEHCGRNSRRRHMSHLTLC